MRQVSICLRKLCILISALIASVAFAADPGVSGPPRTVTLLTGDQVVVYSNQSRTLKPRARGNGKPVSFVTRSMGSGSKQDVYVIPSDALPLIASGKVDRELFNVTLLLESRFDDQHRSDLPLIVTYHSQSSALAATRAKSTALAALSQTRALSLVNAAASKPNAKQVGQFWDSLVGSNTGASAVAINTGLKRVWLDRALKPALPGPNSLAGAELKRLDRAPVRTLLDGSVSQIGAPAAWAAGYDGTGVRVAVVGTGIDDSHPDLAGKVVAARNFADDGATTLTDYYGLGTHVASIIAGSGAASGGQYRGVAPGAQLISARMCDLGGNDSTCISTDMIEAMAWSVLDAGAKIVNLGVYYVGHRTPDFPIPDPLDEMVSALTASHGALFIAPAGDNGPSEMSLIASPGGSAAALSVAAVDRAGQTAWFSTRQPIVGYEIKPDISAPGVEIVGARAVDTTWGTPLDDRYIAASGTYMATAHVAGAAALLSQRYPVLSGTQLKGLLMGSARSSAATSIAEQGAGQVDVEAAFAAAVLSFPGSLSFGTALWPHDDDSGIRKEVFLRNVSETEKTLTFRFEVAGPDGAPAPAGFFTVSPTSLTIGPRSNSSLRITADTRVGSTYGVLLGKLIATSSDGSSTQIPVTVHREEESYNLTLRNYDDQGAPAFFSGTIIRTDAAAPVRGVGELEENTYRLPAGRYSIQSMIYGSGVPAVMIRPQYVHAATQTLTFDAREAQLVEPVAPTATSVLFNADLTWSIKHPGGVFEDRYLEFPPRPQPVRVATLGEPTENIRSTLVLQWNDPADASASTRQTESIYSGAWVKQGQLIESGPRSLPQDKLAVVREEFLGTFPGVNNARSAIGAIDRSAGSFWVPRPVALPSHRKAYYYSDGDGDIRWYGMVLPETSEYMTFESATSQFVPGARYSDRWFEPPFSPTFPENVNPGAFINRSGDILRVTPVPMYGDKAGHGGDNAQNFYVLSLGEQSVECNEGFPCGFILPSELNTYVLEAVSTQNVLPVSTQVQATWTFDSEHVSGGTQRVPLLTVRMRPNLDAQGRVPRNKPLLIPMVIRQHGVEGLAEVSAVTVEASVDDGTTWQAMPVWRDGKKWFAKVTHPQSGEYVSLRLTAQGTGNNRVEETILRAYGLTDTIAP